MTAPQPRPTIEQLRFLRFFLDGPPDRKIWLRSGRRLGPVAEPFAIEPAADRLLVYRLDNGEESFRGDTRNRTTLGVSDLRELEHCWEVPLRQLNERGRRLATAPLPEPLVGRSLKLPRHIDDALRRRAAASGVTVTALFLRMAMAELENDHAA